MCAGVGTGCVWLWRVRERSRRDRHSTCDMMYRRPDIVCLEFDVAWFMHLLLTDTHVHRSTTSCSRLSSAASLKRFREIVEGGEGGSWIVAREPRATLPLIMPDIIACRILRCYFPSLNLKAIPLPSVKSSRFAPPHASALTVNACLCQRWSTDRVKINHPSYVHTVGQRLEWDRP